MHKKTIQGREYYYTSYRDKDGKVRTKYLGSNYEESLKKEESFMTKGKPTINVGWGVVSVLLILLFMVGGFFFIDGPPTGFFFLQDTNTVIFPLQEEWNLTNGLVEISQNASSQNITNITNLVENESIVVYLDNYNLSEGDTTVDLIINGTVVESEFLYYTPPLLENVTEPLVNVTEPQNETVAETQEEDIAYSEEHFETSTNDVLQLDNAFVKKETLFDTATTASCENGSVSEDVTALTYLWYINKGFLNYQTGSTLTASLYNLNDRVECGIVPLNATTPIAYWMFDNGSQDIAYELITNRSGVITNPLWVDGRNYRALNFTAGGFVNVTNTTGLNVSFKFSYEFWIMPRATEPAQAQTQTIFRSNNTDIELFRKNVTFSAPQTGEPPPSATNLIYSTIALENNNWYYVAITYDNETLKLYINGTLNNNVSLGGALGSSSGDIIFGAGNNEFVGFLDEFVIYNHTLSDTEILDHYLNGIVKLSLNTKTKTDTEQSDFIAGDCSEQVNCTRQPGNITLANPPMVSFFSRGNFTSRTLHFPNARDEATLYWNNESNPGQNISFQIRTGKVVNTTPLWSHFSGPDPTHQGDANIVLGLDFSEEPGNQSINVANDTHNAFMNWNEIIPAGKHGRGARLNGEDFIFVDDYPEIQLNGSDFTIELWINPTDNTNVGILEKDSYSMRIGAASLLNLGGLFGGATTSLQSSSTITKNNWTHIAATLDSASTLTLYVNGVPEATSAVSGVLNSSTNIPLAIGNGSFGADPFTGTMDSIVFYDRVLSPTEIRTHARDVFTTPGIVIGDIDQFVMYKVALTTNNTLSTPVISDVSVKVTNYSNFVYNSPPTAVTPANPANSSNITNTTNFNWSTASDIDSDTIFYEFVIANDTDFTIPTFSRLAINNFSKSEITDDNYTKIVAHFDFKAGLSTIGWTVDNATSTEGRFGNGFRFFNHTDNLYVSRDFFTERATTIELFFRPNWNAGEGQTNVLFTLEDIDFSLGRQGNTLIYTLNSTNITYDISAWDKEWHHIAVAWELKRNMTLYVDGASVNTTLTPNLTLSGDTFYVGSDENFDNSANGTIDELKISNVHRFSFEDLSSRNIEFDPTLITDGTYYWKARPVNYYPVSRDNETIHQAWSTGQTITSETLPPVITPLIHLRRLVSDDITAINVTSNEPATCQFRNATSSFVTMNETGGLNHGHNFNITRQGLYSFYVNCLDNFGKSGNTTVSFYIYDQDKSHGNQSIFVNFTAGLEKEINFTGTDGIFIGGLRITTSNNISGRVGMVTHSATLNPEANTTGLTGDRLLRPHTIILDQQIHDNIIGNVTLLYSFITSNFANGVTGSQAFFYYNYTVGQWHNRTLFASFDGTVDGYVPYNISNEEFGTYVMTIETTQATEGENGGGGGTAEGGLADVSDVFFDDEIYFEEEPLEFYFDVIFKDTEYTIEVYDEDIGILDILFVTNKDLFNVFFFIGSVNQFLDNTCNEFAIDGHNIATEDLNIFSIAHAAPKECVNQYSEDIEFALENSDGEQFNVFYIDEDEDFFYFETDTKSLGPFAFTLKDVTEPAIAAPGVEGEIVPERVVQTIQELFKPENLLVILYVLLGSLILFYGSRFGISVLYSLKKRYNIEPKELLIKEDNTVRLQYYAYQNIQNPALKQELMKQGLSSTKANRVISNAQKLPRENLTRYLLVQMAKDIDNEAIVSALVQNGWNKTEVRKVIKQIEAV